MKAVHTKVTKFKYVKPGKVVYIVPENLSGEELLKTLKVVLYRIYGIISVSIYDTEIIQSTKELEFRTTGSINLIKTINNGVDISNVSTKNIEIEEETENLKEPDNSNGEQLSFF